MNLQFFLEKLNHSNEFKDFMNEYSDAFLSSGFFVIDIVGKDKKYHLDYYIPSKNKMFAFQLEDGIKSVEVDLFDEAKPTPLKGDSEIEFDELQKIISEKMISENVKNSLQKILISLQTIDGVDFYVCTCFISGMGLLKILINGISKEVTSFEKKSFFDMMRKG